MRDLDGNHVDRHNLPKLVDHGTFEGEVEWKFYKCAVEYAGLCQHCHGIVSGVVHIADPVLQKEIRSLRETVVLQKMVARIMRARHQCSVIHEGKTNSDDWLKSLEKH